MAIFDGKGYTGIIGEYVYYKKDGKYCRRKRPVKNPDRIDTPGSIANKNEFANLQKATKLFRAAFEEVILYSKDFSGHNRITSLFSKIKNLDISNIKGLRNVYDGLKTENGKKMLIAYNFNNLKKLNQISISPYILNREIGQITFKNFIPGDLLSRVKNADKADFYLYWSNIDFELGKFDTVRSEKKTVVLYNFDKQDLIIQVPNIPEGNGINVVVLEMCFFKSLSASFVTFQVMAADIIDVF